MFCIVSVTSGGLHQYTQSMSSKMFFESDLRSYNPLPRVRRRPFTGRKYAAVTTTSKCSSSQKREMKRVSSYIQIMCRRLSQPKRIAESHNPKRVLVIKGIKISPVIKRI